MIKDYTERYATVLNYDEKVLEEFASLRDILEQKGWVYLGGGKSTAYFRQPDARMFITLNNEILIRFNDVDPVL